MLNFKFSQKSKINKISQSPIKFIFSYYYYIFILFLITLVVSSLSLSFPLFMADTINLFAEKGMNAQREEVPFLKLLLVTVGIFFFSLLQSFFSSKISETIAYDLRRDLAYYISRQNMDFIYKETYSKLLTYFTSDVDAVKNVISQGIISFFSAIFFLVGSFTLLFFISPSLSWLIASGVPFLILIFILIVFKIRKLFKANQENLEQINSHISQSVKASALIRILNARTRQIFDFKRLNERTWTLAVIIVRNFSTLIPLVSFIMNVMMLFIFFFGGRSVMLGEMRVGDLSAFLSYVALLLFPVFSIAGAMGVLTQSFVSLKRILSLLSKPLSLEEGSYQSALEGQYIFKDVTLEVGEEKERNFLLKNINFSLSDKKSVAIVGALGSGKTQMINLMTGLVSPSKGEVLVDGVSLKEWDSSSYYSQIGVVFQESVLFSGTLRDNLNYGKSTEEDIWLALETAQLKNFILNLPLGLETKLSEYAQDLSGGQKQRLMLARALTNRPKVLFLDDFTARLDFRTSHKVRSALRENYPNIKIIYTSQTSFMTQEADWIIFLSQGEILAQGTYESLIQNCWEYRQLVNSNEILE